MRIAPWNPSEICWALTQFERGPIYWNTLCFYVAVLDVTMSEYSCSHPSSVCVCVFLYILLILSIILKRKKSNASMKQSSVSVSKFYFILFLYPIYLPSSSACPKDTKTATIALQSSGKPLFYSPRGLLGIKYNETYAVVEKLPWKYPLKLEWTVEFKTWDSGKQCLVFWKRCFICCLMWLNPFYSLFKYSCCYFELLFCVFLLKLC